MCSSFTEIYKNRKILLYTTYNDIKAKYTGTFFGMFWAFLYPVLFLGLYSVVYLYVFKIRLPDMSQTEYVLVIFSGLIPFLGFAEALGTGVGSVVSNANLLKNTMFPIELVPIKAVLTSSVTMLVGLCILLPILWLKDDHYLTQIFVPIIFILQLMFTIGVIWIVSCLNVFIRDLSQMVSVMVLFLMLISPIAYTLEMIPNGLMPFMYSNPLFYLITLYRSTMLEGEVPFYILLIFSTGSLSIYIFGYFMFTKLKPIFADHV